MRSFKLKDFTKGWVIGDFEPNILKTKKFEVGIKKYVASDEENKHYHKIAQEITIAVSGKFEINSQIITEGDIIMLEPGEPAIFKCLESGYTAVVKVPSVKNDKYTV